MKVFSIIWKIIIALLLIGAAIAFVSQLGHAESLSKINSKGTVGQRVKVHGYVHEMETLEGGRLRLVVCDWPRSVPRSHYNCVNCEFVIPSQAYRWPSPGEEVSFKKAKIIRKE